MRTFILFLLPFVSLAQIDSSKFEIYNDAIILNNRFLKDPFLRLQNDTLNFKMSDSVITVESVNSNDSSSIWIFYKDMGFNDFWETYLRNKYNQGWAGRREHDKSPKKFIREYFDDKEIDLLEIIIYSSDLKTGIFLMCGSCYSGTDFLFKVKKKDYEQLCEETQLKLNILKNNFR